MGVSIILPVYNEETNIIEVISDIVYSVRNIVKDFDIIAVNDGSTDSTLDILMEMRNLYPELVIISYAKNKGYGAAIKAGIQLSQREWIFILDSDRQLRIENFKTFWEKKENYDFVIGYREKRKDSIYRILLSKIGNATANLFLKNRIIDVNCACKLFKGKELKNLRLISTGGCIYFEIFFHWLNTDDDSLFLQLPVIHHRRENGRQTGGSAHVVIKNIREGIRIVFRKQTKIF